MPCRTRFMSLEGIVPEPLRQQLTHVSLAQMTKQLPYHPLSNANRSPNQSTDSSVELLRIATLFGQSLWKYRLIAQTIGDSCQ
eukprot:1271639-Amphidinium_carterae.2